jgi:CDP-diacylglycerol---glycerol-3-phosphate 3-phosphatidyltransferase
MARSGDHERFAALIAEARELDPDAVFRSNFILGFPGETERRRRPARGVPHRAAARLGRAVHLQPRGRHAVGHDARPGPREVARERLGRVSEVQERVADAAAAGSWAATRRDRRRGRSTATARASGAPTVRHPTPTARSTLLGPTGRPAVAARRSHRHRPCARLGRCRPGRRGRSRDGRRQWWLTRPGRTIIRASSDAGAGRGARRAGAGPDPLTRDAVNLPNAFTFLRAALVPVILWLLLRRRHPGAPLVGVRDLHHRGADRLRRRLGGPPLRHGITAWGQLADPIADKLLIIGVLASLAIVGEVPWWAVIVIVAREVAVTVLRTRLVQRLGLVMPASHWGKVKTISQMIAIGAYLLPVLGGLVPDCCSTSRCAHDLVRHRLRLPGRAAGAAVAAAVSGRRTRATCVEACPGAAVIDAAAVLSVGSELLLGDLTDTNATWLSRRLTEHGIEVVHHLAVGDDLDRARRGAAGGWQPIGRPRGGRRRARADRDDLTREAIAAATGGAARAPSRARGGAAARFAGDGPATWPPRTSSRPASRRGATVSRRSAPRRVSG